MARSAASAEALHTTSASSSVTPDSGVTAPTEESLPAVVFPSSALPPPLLLLLLLLLLPSCASTMARRRILPG